MSIPLADGRPTSTSSWCNGNVVCCAFSQRLLHHYRLITQSQEVPWSFDWLALSLHTKTAQPRLCGTTASQWHWQNYGTTRKPVVQHCNRRCNPPSSALTQQCACRMQNQESLLADMEPEAMHQPPSQLNCREMLSRHKRPITLHSVYQALSTQLCDVLAFRPVIVPCHLPNAQATTTMTAYSLLKGIQTVRLHAALSSEPIGLMSAGQRTASHRQPNNMQVPRTGLMKLQFSQIRTVAPRKCTHSCAHHIHQHFANTHPQALALVPRDCLEDSQWPHRRH